MEFGGDPIYAAWELTYLSQCFQIEITWKRKLFTEGARKRMKRVPVQLQVFTTKTISI